MSWAVFYITVCIIYLLLFLLTGFLILQWSLGWFHIHLHNNIYLMIICSLFLFSLFFTCIDLKLGSIFHTHMPCYSILYFVLLSQKNFVNHLSIVYPSSNIFTLLPHMRIRLRNHCILQKTFCSIDDDGKHDKNNFMLHLETCLGILWGNVSYGVPAYHGLHFWCRHHLYYFLTWQTLSQSHHEQNIA